MTLNNRAFWSQAKTAQVQQRLVYTMERTRASPEMGVKACLKKKNVSSCCQTAVNHKLLFSLSYPCLICCLERRGNYVIFACGFFFFVVFAYPSLLILFASRLEASVSQY